MQPTYLFLDTEWADAGGAELVSLALVSEDGSRVFYAERDPLPTEPTEFVARVVYPLLERGHAAQPDRAITQALRAFLRDIPTPFVLADYPNDVKLFRHVLDGAYLASSEAAECGMISAVVTTVMDREGATTRLLERWFARHPDQAARRHNALVDAYALRMAWMAATHRDVGEWAAERH